MAVHGNVCAVISLDRRLLVSCATRRGGLAVRDIFPLAFAVDERLARRIRALPHARSLDHALAGWSVAVEHGRLWVAVGALGALGALGDGARREQWARGLTAVCATELAVQALKGSVRRERLMLPGYPALAATPSRFSFPSAHTATTAAATVFAPLVPGLPWCSVLGAMAFSRVYLGVHFPSDVAVGGLTGLLVGTLACSAGDIQRRSADTAR